MPYIITGGGPGNATRVLSMLIYETGFSYMKMGQAAAISVVLFAFMLVFTVLQMRLFCTQRAGLRADASVAQRHCRRAVRGELTGSASAARACWLIALAILTSVSSCRSSG